MPLEGAVHERMHTGKSSHLKFYKVSYGMDLFQGGILTGEKIKIKNKESFVNENSDFASTSVLKRRHSTTLFPPRHSGKTLFTLLFRLWFDMTVAGGRGRVAPNG